MKDSKKKSSTTQQTQNIEYTTQTLQINFYKNMEFFRSCNAKLFHSLAKEPSEYNLHVDNHGFNIIHLPSQKLHYPIITHKGKQQTSMLVAHNEIAQNPIHNPKWNIFANFNPFIESQFINTDKLPITGKHHNHILKAGMQFGLEKQNDSKNGHSMQTQASELLFHNLLESFNNQKLLPQTTIYGLMGGIFLQNILLQNYRFHSLLIYEENIDLFRISLYFLDYEKLFAHVEKNSCFIIIKDIKEPLLRAFLQTRKITNNFLSLELKHYSTNTTQYLKNLIFKEKKAIMRGWGSFEDEIIGFQNALSNLKNCNLLYKQPKRINAPICIVGNGASLDLCIEFIQENKQNMIIFSCGTALKVLRHHNIIPDFQVEIERVPYLADVLKEAKLENIPLLFAQTTDVKACTLAHEAYAFLRGGSASAYLPDHSLVMEFSAPFVGNAGVALGAFLGSDCILCGIDCGYIKGYSKHAKNSFYGIEQIEIPKDCFQVDGNKNNEVFSNDLFYMSAKNIEEAIKLYKPNTVINLGYGAKLEGAQSLFAKDFTLKKINKNKEIKKLKALFTPYKLPSSYKNIMHEHLDLFAQEITALLNKDIKDLGAVLECCDGIFFLLQKFIADSKKRKSIILLEGSILHLSFSFILSCLFAGNKETYGTIKEYFKQGIGDLICHCKHKL